MSGFDVTNPEKPVIEKDPDAVLDYTFDWTDWLADVSDTISTKTIIVQTGLTNPSSTVLPGNLKVTVWLSGGTIGTKYSVTCRIVTVGGRTDDRTFYVKIKDR